MPKPLKHTGHSRDIDQAAHHLVNVLTEENHKSVQLPTEAQISALMAQLGRKGGKIGGKRRLETLSSLQRKRIAKKAARARWNKTR